ncbi:MAG: CvpA family protein [Rhizobiales bacterium]|nr:CvpA family protein [Hyphomicrobiales bacterium]MBI3674947.1 CvpA family protein [Hyphomicrobiales bacterium]
MGFQLLDLILLGIMLISGLLALARGFTREALSLVAWGLAALAAYFAIKQPKLLDLAMTKVPFITTPILAQIAVGAAAFLVVLVVVSVVSVKISDMVVDSSAGGFDRTLGFFYGLARGFVLVAIAYLFYGWLLPFDRQEVWVKEARSLPYIKYVGDKLLAFMPAEIADTLSKTALQKTTEPPAAAKGNNEAGYQNNETQGLGNLIEGTGGDTAAPQAPQFGQSSGQSTGQ